MTRVVHSDLRITLWHGDALETLRLLPSGSVDCVVTSPPYFWMRDYGEERQQGLEPTPGEYIAGMVEVFTEVRRVLADDGTLWLNVGDAYSQRKAIRRSSHQDGLHPVLGKRPTWRESRADGRARMSYENIINGRAVPEKSLMLLPERIAMGMVDAGWMLRNKITWAKTFCLPDPVTDRLAVRSEPLFLFSKSPRYYFDRTASEDYGDVWRLSASGGAGIHTASYPTALPERCIRLGCKPGGTVLDPYAGSGTTGKAALDNGYQFVGIDLSLPYLTQALATTLNPFIDAEVKS